MAKEILFNEEARRKLEAGVNALADFLCFVPMNKDTTSV